MIGPKTPKPTKAQQSNAYALAAARDPRCVRCGIYGVTMDHRQNRQSGNTRPSNLQGLCGTGTTGCHGWKTNNPADALADGYAVSRWQDPAEWPARRKVGMHLIWVLYDDLGNYREITAAAAARRLEGDFRDDDDSDSRDAVRGVLAAPQGAQGGPGVEDVAASDAAAHWWRGAGADAWPRWWRRARRVGRAARRVRARFSDGRGQPRRAPAWSGVYRMFPRDGCSGAPCARPDF